MEATIERENAEKRMDDIMGRLLRTVPGIIHEALALHGRGLIQFGLLLLIATPIARVAFSVVAFLHQRDWTYVAVTLIVLSLLFYSLLGSRT